VTDTVALESVANEVSSLAAAGDLDGAANCFLTLLSHEGQLCSRNLIGPYQDTVPLLLSILSKDVISAILNRLPPAEGCRVLFGGPPDVRSALAAATLAAMRVAKAAAIIKVSSLGAKTPSDMAAALPAMPKSVLKNLLDHVHPDALARLVWEMPCPYPTRVWYWLP